MRTVDLDTITLTYGSHNPDSQYCVMELAAYIAEEPWSDHPQSVSPVIGAFLRNWNDSLDAKTRQMLKPYAVTVIGTRGTKKQESKRAWMATDRLARECAPAFLRLAGLTDHAEALENLVALTTATGAKAAQPKLNAARDAARAAAGAAARAAAGAAARAAAGAAAGDVAWAAARAAAGAAAGAAARAAAGDVAWDAAGAAAGAAARAVAQKKLAPTVKALQQSALGLLDRMIAVTA